MTTPITAIPMARGCRTTKRSISAPRRARPAAISGYEYADHTDANGDGKCDDCGATVSLTISGTPERTAAPLMARPASPRQASRMRRQPPRRARRSKAGHAFKGWYTSASGGSLYNTVTITVAKTFYAQFTANSYTLTWDLGNGTTEETKQTYGEKLTLPTEPTRKNAEFLGWFYGSKRRHAGRCQHHLQDGC